jgi:O-antigen/teichoic acid export membrane protein
LVTLILARLLTPRDFGLIAIISFIVYILGILQNLGLSQALIYRRDDLDKISNTAFILALGLGVISSCAGILVAPFVAALFKEPQATPLAQVLVISLAISSIGLVPETLLIARLDFGRKFIADVSSGIGYAVIATGLAGWGLGAWSIVFGRLIESAVRVSIVWYLAKWKPKARFEWITAREILVFGKDIAISSILAIVFLNIDNVFISRMLDTTQLGYYTFAFSLATMPAIFAQRVVDTVSFPTYTQIRETEEILVRAYLKSLRIIAMLVLPVNLGLLTISPVLIQVLYGNKWHSSIILIQILSLYGLVRAMANAPTTILLAIGKQYLFPRFTLVYVIIAAVTLEPAISLAGTVGAATVMTTIVWAGGLVWVVVANYYLSLPFRKFFQTILAPTVASLFMALIVQMIMYFLDETVFSLAIMVSVGCITYIIILIVITKGEAVNDAKEIIHPLIHRSSAL